MVSLHRNGHEQFLTTQNVAQFWNVCTRPRSRCLAFFTACLFWVPAYFGLTRGYAAVAWILVDVTFQIPDDVANRGIAAGDLSRRALEAFTLEELRAGRITEVELRMILGLERIELDGFLKAHGIYQEYTLEDFEEERSALKELGL